MIRLFALLLSCICFSGCFSKMVMEQSPDWELNHRYEQALDWSPLKEPRHVIGTAVPTTTVEQAYRLDIAEAPLFLIFDGRDSRLTDEEPASQGGRRFLPPRHKALDLVLSTDSLAFRPCDTGETASALLFIDPVPASWSSSARMAGPSSHLRHALPNGQVVKSHLEMRLHRVTEEHCNQAKRNSRSLLLLSVPFDILTSPLQLVGLFFYQAVAALGLGGHP